MQVSELRSAYIDLIVSHNPNITITLGVGKGDMLPLSFHKSVKHFLNTQRREAFGRNWYHRSGDVVAFGFMEHLKTNPHMHISATVKDAGFAEQLLHGGCAWRQIRHGGDYCCEEIRDVDRYASYITKEFWNPENQEADFLYTSPGRFLGRKRKL